MNQENEVKKEAMLEAAHHDSSGLSQVFGGGLGGSPVSQLKQDQLISIQHIRANLKDIDGCLQKALIELVESSDTLFSESLGQPLIVLRRLLNGILSKQSRLEELTQRADILYGQQYSERPMFQKSGQVAQAGDPYTHEGVREAIEAYVVTSQ